MEKLIWKEEEMSSGFDHIDSQHRFIVNSFNIIKDAILNNRSEEIIERMIEALSAHVEHHFRDEEKILEKEKKLTEKHKKEHQEFQIKIDELKNKDKDLISEEFLSYLENWIRHHFFEIDLPPLKTCKS